MIRFRVERRGGPIGGKGNLAFRNPPGAHCEA